MPAPGSTWSQDGRVKLSGKKQDGLTRTAATTCAWRPYDYRLVNSLCAHPPITMTTATTGAPSNTQLTRQTALLPGPGLPGGLLPTARRGAPTHSAQSTAAPTARRADHPDHPGLLTAISWFGQTDALGMAWVPSGRGPLVGTS